MKTIICPNEGEDTIEVGKLDALKAGTILGFSRSSNDVLMVMRESRDLEFRVANLYDERIHEFQTKTIKELITDINFCYKKKYDWFYFQNLSEMYEKLEVHMSRNFDHK